MSIYWQGDGITLHLGDCRSADDNIGNCQPNLVSLSGPESALEQGVNPSGPDPQSDTDRRL